MWKWPVMCGAAPRMGCPGKWRAGRVSGPYGRLVNHPVGAAALGGPFHPDRGRAARQGCRALRIAAATALIFQGMAPMAARRAKPVQRSRSQGLRGNPDACRPRRGSACNISAKGAGGNARPVYALSVQPTAAVSPRTGGSRVGGAPRPFFPPISSGRNGGAVVGPSCGLFASGQARKLIPSAGPPLPTTTPPLGRRGGPIGRVPGGTPADGRPQVAPTDAGG